MFGDNFPEILNFSTVALVISASALATVAMLIFTCCRKNEKSESIAVDLSTTRDEANLNTDTKLESAKEVSTDAEKSPKLLSPVPSAKISPNLSPKLQSAKPSPKPSPKNRSIKKSTKPANLNMSRKMSKKKQQSRPSYSKKRPPMVTWVEDVRKPKKRSIVQRKSKKSMKMPDSAIKTTPVKKTATATAPLPAAVVPASAHAPVVKQQQQSAFKIIDETKLGQKVMESAVQVKGERSKKVAGEMTTTVMDDKSPIIDAASAFRQSEIQEQKEKQTSNYPVKQAEQSTGFNIYPDKKAATDPNFKTELQKTEISPTKPVESAWNPPPPADGAVGETRKDYATMFFVKPDALEATVMEKN